MRRSVGAVPSNAATREPRPDSQLCGHWRLTEPQLAFDLVDPNQRHVNPLVGLDRFGPNSARTLGVFVPEIRIAMLSPAPDLTRLRQQLNELWVPQQPRERVDYLPAFRGFPQVMRTKLRPATDSAQVLLPADLDTRLAASSAPHRVLAAALIDVLRQLLPVRDVFDVVVFYLPRRYHSLFELPEENFHLHDTVKGFAATSGLTTQIITDEALEYTCRASVAWRLSIALYAKAGGTPWALPAAPGHQPDEYTTEDVAYIGLSYALRPSADGATTFVTCCSQVFDADGGGMEFIAYDVGEGRDLHNPYLTRDQMRLVLARSLAVYQRRHAGRSPARLIVHRQSPFRPDEVAGALDAWGGAVQDLTAVNIIRPRWNGFSLVPNRRTGSSRPGYAVDRGTVQQLDGRSALLWVAGNAKSATLSGQANYLQGGKGAPRPLLLTRDAGASSLDEIARQVLALSKLNWNNDSLYDPLPVTLRYAQVLARTIKHLPKLTPRPYDYRLFM